MTACTALTRPQTIYHSCASQVRWMLFRSQSLHISGTQLTHKRSRKHGGKQISGENAMHSLYLAKIKQLLCYYSHLALKITQLLHSTSTIASLCVQTCICVCVCAHVHVSDCVCMHALVHERDAHTQYHLISNQLFILFLKGSKQTTINHLRYFHVTNTIALFHHNKIFIARFFSQRN